MKNSKIKIYCLCDPVSCKVKYIGRTSKKVLKYRLIEHITKSKYFNTYYPNKKHPYKVNWINSLLKKGIEPTIRLLCEIEGWKESHIKEKELIKKYHKKFNLTNADDKGEGELNKIITAQQKIDISKKIKENYKNGYENPVNKAIDVYNLNAEYLYTYKSIIETSRQLKIHQSSIIAVLQNKYNQVKGFQFKYNKEEKIINKLGNYRKCIKKGLCKKIIVEDLLTSDILNFESVKSCATHFNVFSPSINQVLRKSKTKIYKSRYKFYYAPDKQDELLENPTLERQKEGNQQPSLISNSFEGSTTNTQILPNNVEDSNGNTSFLQCSLF